MASNIDNLNFKVILDDKDFNTRVEKDIELAKKLNVELSQLLQAKVKVNSISATEAASAKRASDILTKQATNQEKISQAKAKTAEAEEKVATQAAKTAKEMERGRAAASQTAVNVQRLATEQERTAAATQNASAATSRAALAQKRLADYSKQTTNSIRSQSRLMNELKGYALGYLSIHGATQLISSLVRVTGEFELQKTTLAAMLGDLNEAEQIITRIQGLAVESPFQFKELTTYAKQLSAFSVPAQELYDTTKMLADISAGLGVGMDRIVLAYGQVRSAAFLRGQEVRQFTEAGIPILDELAKQFTELEGRVVSTTEVFDKISSRLVPFEMVAKVFKDMTSEGGKFYNMQEVQAETLRGKISNLKDAYEVMLNEIGSGQSEKLKDVVDWAKRLMENYEDIGKLLVELVVAYGAYKTAVIAAEIATKSFNAANHGVIGSLVKIGQAIATNPYAAIAATLTAVGVLVYKTSTALESYEKVQKSVADSEAKFTRALNKEITKLDTLYAKLKLAEEGTEEYAEARRQIYTQYSGYISELENEGIAVNNLTEIYGKLKDKIEQSAEARFRITAARNLENTYDTEMDKMFDKYEKLTKNIERFIKRTLSATEKEGLWQYLLGNEDILTNTPELHGLNNAIQQYIERGTGVSVVWLKDQISRIITEYEEGKKKIDALFGTEPPQTDTVNPIVNLGAGDGKSAAEKVQEEIDAVKRLRDAYETLAPYMNGEMLRKTLTALFPNADQQLIQSLDFRGKLVALAAELNKFDEEASKKLLDSLSGERASEIASAFKAVETYKNMLDQWLGEDFNLTGEGVTFDISKILRDLNNQYAKINQKAIQASDLLTKAQMGNEDALKTVREVYGEEVWQKYLINGQDVIEELARKEREEARKVADDKIKDLSQKYVKELMTRDNINLTDFDDKTVRQIDELINRLYGLRAEIGNNMFALEFGGLSEEEMSQYEMLKKSLEQIDLLIKDTDVEKEKAMFDQLKDGLEAISQLGSGVEDLGEKIGDANIARLGKDLSQAADLAVNLADALKAKDTVAIITNLLSAFVTEVVEVADAAYNNQVALNNATETYRDILLDIRRESYSGLFGVDEIALAAENTKILGEAQDKYASALKKFNEIRLQGYKSQGGFGREGVKKQSVADMLGYFADKDGWDLYRESGELNIDAIEAYYDTYASSLTRKQRRLVDEIIQNGNALDDAYAQQAEYLTNLFSNVADNIANGMVDAFVESGNAAIDMGNIISDVSRQMVSDLIKSVYLMPILNGYKEQFEAINANASLTPTQKAEAQLNMLETALQQIAGQSDAITETIERFADYLGTGEGTKDLGEGIKGITEDQANLLASYLNAIRADVAYSKTLWQSMDSNLQRIADMLVSSPSLMEYQAQIAANTYNTAQTTQAILARLNDVIAIGDYGEGIKIIS